MTQPPSMGRWWLTNVHRKKNWKSYTLYYYWVKGKQMRGVFLDYHHYKPNTGALDGVAGGGVLILHVDSMKPKYRPVEFKKCLCSMSLPV